MKAERNLRRVSGSENARKVTGIQRQHKGMQWAKVTCWIPWLSGAERKVAHVPASRWIT